MAVVGVLRSGCGGRGGNCRGSGVVEAKVGCCYFGYDDCSCGCGIVVALKAKQRCSGGSGNAVSQPDPVVTLSTL